MYSGESSAVAEKLCTVVAVLILSSWCLKLTDVAHLNILSYCCTFSALVSLACKSLSALFDGVLSKHRFVTRAVPSICHCSKITTRTCALLGLQQLGGRYLLYVVGHIVWGDALLKGALYRACWDRQQQKSVRHFMHFLLLVQHPASLTTACNKHMHAAVTLNISGEENVIFLYSNT